MQSLIKNLGGTAGDAEGRMTAVGQVPVYWHLVDLSGARRAYRPTV